MKSVFQSASRARSRSPQARSIPHLVLLSLLISGCAAKTTTTDPLQTPRVAPVPSEPEPQHEQMPAAESVTPGARLHKAERSANTILLTWSIVSVSNPESFLQRMMCAAASLQAGGSWLRCNGAALMSARWRPSKARAFQQYVQSGIAGPEWIGMSKRRAFVTFVYPLPSTIRPEDRLQIEVDRVNLQEEWGLGTDRIPNIIQGSWQLEGLSSPVVP